MIEQCSELKREKKKKVSGGDFFFATQNSKYRTHTNLRRPILIAISKNANSFATKGRMEASGRAMDAQSHYLFRYL